jgi:hypothetical protein
MTMKSIRETVHSDSLRVDRNAGVIRGVKILGKESKNGRTYSSRAMNEAACLYEGAKVNVDHPDGDGRAERGFLDSLGELRNVQRGVDAVYGDLHFIKSHPAAPVLCESAERFPKQFGLSHIADGDLQERDGQWVVESIQAVHSVDVVSRPATNDGLFESARNHEGNATMIRTTLRRLVELHGTPKQKARLVEMDGSDAAMQPEWDATVAIPSADADGDGQIDAAFKKLVISVLDHPTADVKTKLKRIGEILKAQEKLMTGGTSLNDELDDEAVSVTDPTQESFNRQMPFMARESVRNALGDLDDSDDAFAARRLRHELGLPHDGHTSSSIEKFVSRMR